jgi:uncharacterized protein (TIGR02246 family)
MKWVSWSVVVLSMGWLLAWYFGGTSGWTFPPVSPAEVSATAVSVPARDQGMQAFADAYTRAWNSHDPASVAAFYAADGEIVINGDDPHVGTDGVENMADGYLQAFPDIHLSMDALERRGESYLYRWTFTGTHSGTGRPVRISGSETWRMGADGLIARSVGQYDATDYQRQVEGISPD